MVPDFLSMGDMIASPLWGPAVLAAVLATTVLASNGAAAADPENTLYMDLEYGRVVIEMRPDLAPNHVARIKELVRKKFYDGLLFHRVIAGFMAMAFMGFSGMIAIS